MAYVKPTDLDGFIVQMGKSDVRMKTQIAEDLVNYLSDYENTLVCSDLGLLVDALMPWLTGSHFKVSLKHNNMTLSPRDKIAKECELLMTYLCCSSQSLTNT